MSEGYGKKIGKAFAAIYQLHLDISKLFSDCDSTIGKGMASIFGSVVTKDLSRANYEPGSWMPYAAYRYYDATAEGPGLVDGVTVHFWDEPPKPDEPMLVLGRIKYRVDDEAEMGDVCDGWDLWYAAFEWSKSHLFGQISGLQDVGEARIEWMKITVVPLYSIKSMQEVERLMDLARQAAT